jgi:protein-tyrosine phosphatase
MDELSGHGRAIVAGRLDGGPYGYIPSMHPPIPASYWVVPGRLLAGAYPGALAKSDTATRLAAFHRSGVTSFVDLTEEHEGLVPYDTLLPKAVRYARRPIVDFECPAPEQLAETLDLIDSELERGEVVYVHCFGGRGRTGTVVGCWLVRHGSSGEEALAKIENLREHAPGPSPETEEQRQLVRFWSEPARRNVDLGPALSSSMRKAESREE